MSIRIKKPEALYETGKRELNEDFIFPLMNEASSDERIFIVADGEGGPQAGDVGSKLLALTMAKYFQVPGPKGEVSEDFLAQALKISEGALSAHKDGHPEAKHMAMSLALLHLGDTKATLAWIGSARVYHFSSETGTLLNPDTVQEDNKPQNQDLITGSENPQTLNVHYIPVENLEPGDFFLLVTDGVRDQLNDRNLETLFKSSSVSSAQYNPERVATEINNLIQNFSDDNYSAYIIQLQTEDEKKAAAAAGSGGSEKGGEKTSEDKQSGANSSATASSSKRSFQQKDIIRYVVIGLVALFAVSMLGWGGYRYFSKSFNRQMSRADKALEERDFDKAREYYTKALQGTDDPSLQQKARNQLESLEIAMQDNPDGKIESANKFVEEGNYESAIGLYEMAIKRLDERGNKLKADETRVALGETFIKQANVVYDSADAANKCKDAIDLYTKGLTILRQPELKTSETELLAMASKREQQCGKELGYKNVTPDGINARQSAPPKTDKQSSSNEAARIVPNTPTTPPAEAQELKKWLASGKRTFVQARNSGSEDQYRQAVESLENSGAMLDGAGAYMLSYLYHSGLGVRQDEEKALKYAQKSANMGWPSGQFYYGHLLLLREYPRDTVTAIQSLRKAADKNFKSAIERLQELGVPF